MSNKHNVLAIYEEEEKLSVKIMKSLPVEPAIRFMYKFPVDYASPEK